MQNNTYAQNNNIKYICKNSVYMQNKRSVHSEYKTELPNMIFRENEDWSHQ